jgi:hypothetical protein
MQLGCGRGLYQKIQQFCDLSDLSAIQQSKIIADYFRVSHPYLQMGMHPGEHLLAMTTFYSDCP